jgi:arylsulfatase A-like enzyme
MSTKRSRRWAWMAVLLVALGAAAVIVTRKIRHPHYPNIIFIVLDTLRADRLGAYGNKSGLTPFLDELARRSIVYERAYSASSWTVPSIASMFLAEYSSEHGVNSTKVVLPGTATTFPEILQRNGFLAAGFSANIQITADRGYGRGCETFQTSQEKPKGDASELNQLAIEWLQSHKGSNPKLLYLQYMEPHCPYRPHPGLTPSGRGSSPTTDGELNDRLLNGAIAAGLGDHHPWHFTPQDVNRLQDLYDGEVRYLDGQLAQLFQQLDKLGFLAHAMVIVTADHGEEFGEHGVFNHGTTLFNPEIHVPLLVQLPGEKQGRRISRPVGTAGLAPAILGLLDITEPSSFHIHPLPFTPSPADGRDALYAYSERQPTQAMEYVLHRRALTTASEKLLIGTDGKRTFFNLSADPGEQSPLLDPPFAATLNQDLTRVTSQLHGAGAHAVSPMDAAERDRLRALGYVQ